MPKHFLQIRKIKKHFYLTFTSLINLDLSWTINFMLTISYNINIVYFIHIVAGIDNKNISCSIFVAITLSSVQLMARRAKFDLRLGTKQEFIKFITLNMHFQCTLLKQL